MAADRPLLGVTLILLFCVLAPLADAAAKLLGPLLPLGQIVALRFLAQGLILIPLSLATGRSWRLAPRHLALLVLRTLLHICGIAMVVTALIYLPLADAVAIAYVMPFIALLLGWFFLGEEVGWRRLAACVAGFTGTLLVLQPAFTDVGWPALLPLAVAVIFAVYMLLSRQLAQTLDPITQQAQAALIACALLLPALALTPAAQVPMLAWAPLESGTWTLVCMMGLTGTLAHLVMTWALKFAPTSTLAPMQYLEIPFAALVGFVIFDDLPGALAVLGISITIAAGVYIVLREHHVQRKAARRET